MFGEQGIGTSAASDSSAGSPFGGPGGFGQEVDLGDIFGNCVVLLSFKSKRKIEKSGLEMTIARKDT